MAQYHHLSIYKKAFDLLVKITQATSNFSRDFRYTLGEKLNNGHIEFIVNIYKANGAKLKERREYILVLLDKLQYTNIYIRLSCELKNISRDKYIELIGMTEDLEKQLTGWFNHTETEIKTQQPEEDNSDQINLLNIS